MAAYNRGLGLLVCATLAMALGSAGAMAKGNDCIELARLKHTKAVDNQTIVATLKAKGEFRRISLASPCGGLKFHDAFSFATPENRLCSGTSITVVKTGSVCSIAAIDLLAAEDASALLKRPATARGDER